MIPQDDETSSLVWGAWSEYGMACLQIGIALGLMMRPEMLGALPEGGVE